MALAPLTGPGGLTSVAGAPALVAAPTGSGFAAEVGRAVDGLQSTQAVANASASQAAAGSGNVADAMIAASRATLATQLTVTMTQKAVDAFTAIMNMQV